MDEELLLDDSAMLGSDASFLLSQGLLTASVQLDANAIKCLMFMSEYVNPAYASNFRYKLMELKKHQTPGLLKRLVEALRAIAMIEQRNSQPLDTRAK